jgi:xylan 1,4-beta-xylosidase
MKRGELQFYFTQQRDQWHKVGPVLDATVLSDEYKVEVKFTGAFAGVCVQDLSGPILAEQRCVADFDWFEIEATPEGTV